MNVPKPPKITIDGYEVPHAAALWLCYVAAKGHNAFGKGKIADLIQPTIDAMINGGENIDHFREAKPSGLAGDHFPRLNAWPTPMYHPVDHPSYESGLNQAAKREMPPQGRPNDTEGCRGNDWGSERFYSQIDGEFWIFDPPSKTRWVSRWKFTVPEYMQLRGNYKSSVNPFKAWWRLFRYRAVAPPAP